MSSIEHLIEEAKVYATKIILDYPDTNVYHDIKFAHRLQNNILKVGQHAKLKSEEIALGQLGAWLVASSFKNVKTTLTSDGIPNSNLEEATLKNALAFFDKNFIDEKYKVQLLESIPEIDFNRVPESTLGKLLRDSMTADIVDANSKKRLKKIYEELILHDVSISKKKWYDTAIKISSGLEFHLPYCREEFQPKIDQLVLDLQKEKKQLEKNTDLALKKELKISDAELKDLKKNLRDVSGRDARAIQTVFRTTSKNHYTLNEMVDKKANIMITVNSIILSLVLGGVIGTDASSAALGQGIQLIPILILTLAALGSIFFAILSIRPDVTHGQFMEEEIRNKKGNLLFYGNFHDMQERDYEWGFLQMINDQDHLYSTMIKDIYYLGQVLNRKYKQIRYSLTIFLIGIVLAVILYVAINAFCIM